MEKLHQFQESSKESWTIFAVSWPVGLLRQNQISFPTLKGGETFHVKVIMVIIMRIIIMYVIFTGR